MPQISKRIQSRPGYPSLYRKAPVGKVTFAQIAIGCIIVRFGIITRVGGAGGRKRRDVTWTVLCSQSLAGQQRTLSNKSKGIPHAEDISVSWGQFFANLGYTFGNKAITTDNGTYADGQDGNKLSFMLNGEAVNSIQNKLIKSEDVLLINYGKDGTDSLKERFNKIPTDAKQANISKDPATCGAGEESSLTKRIKASLGL